MLRRYSQVFRSVAVCADLLALSAALAGAYWVGERGASAAGAADWPPREEYAALWLGALPVFAALLGWRRLYDSRRQAARGEEARALLGVAALGTLILTAAAYAWSAPISRLALLCCFLFSATGLVALRLAVRSGLAAARRRGFNTRSALIAGSGRLAGELAQRLRSHAEMGFQVRGFVGPERPIWTHPAPWLGPYSALRDAVVAREIDHVFIALDQGDGGDPLALAAALRDTTASVRIAMDLSGLQTIRAGVEELDGVPILRVVESPVLGWASVGKRALDIAVASAALLLLAPLLAAIAAAVRLGSPRGPVLYRQRRMSLDGREFTMLKFRTMVPGAEAQTGPVWARPQDPRCTPLGRLLRRSSLDELPQLWNVLRGQMSLVGPRPERPELIAGFRGQISGYMLRHKVKGGLTGLAQIHGLRGNTSLERRIAADLRYAAEWSLALDLKILLLTPLRAFRDRSAH